MTRIDFGPGTIRMALLGLGFVGITLALALLQPGPRRDVGALPDSAPVSRNDTTTLPDDPAPYQPRIATPVQMQPSAHRSVPQPPSAVTPLTQPATASNTAPELRQMSWGILQQLNDATGRDVPPGDPGSLLHTIVTRAMQDGLSAQPRPDIAERRPVQ